MTHNWPGGHAKAPGEALVRSESGGGTGKPGEVHGEWEEIVGNVGEREIVAGDRVDLDAAVFAEEQSLRADADVYDRGILRRKRGGLEENRHKACRRLSRLEGEIETELAAVNL